MGRRGNKINRNWGYGSYQPTIPRTPKPNESKKDGPCIELKDMDLSKKRKLLKYYRDKYKDVKGRLGTVSSFNKHFHTYLLAHFGNWRGED